MQSDLLLQLWLAPRLSNPEVWRARRKAEAVGGITAPDPSHLLPVNKRHLESRATRPDLRHYDYSSRHVGDACHWAYCPQNHRRARHQKLSAVLLHVALVTYYSKKRKQKTKNTHASIGWKRERMPDLTSHNELVVNGVQWGASLGAAGTVNINTQASCAPSRGENSQ